MRFFQFVILFALVTLPFAVAMADDQVTSSLTPETINAADLTTLTLASSSSAKDSTKSGVAASPGTPDPAIAKLQILLDRAGASPGVIDGLDGDNVRKAVKAFETMAGLSADGKVEADMLKALERDDATPATTTYVVTAKDVSDIGPPIPTDYAEMAKMKFLGYASVPEELAERFHMDEEFLRRLNPTARWTAGEQIAVADPGPNKTGNVARIEADKAERQVRGYDADGKLLVAYPATIGSTDNPSPTGTHLVDAIAPMPNYTYDPNANFTQGNNHEKLVIPPGPNGPVGSMWIDLTDPTFGIHGTPEPSKIDKTNSHGCVRLTNWDAEELAKMVEKGVPVVFTS